MRGVVPPENNVAPSLNVVMPRLQAGVVIEEPPPCHVRAYNAVTGFAWEVVAVSYIVVSSLFDVSFSAAYCQLQRHPNQFMNL